LICTFLDAGQLPAATASVRPGSESSKQLIQEAMRNNLMGLYSEFKHKFNELSTEMLLNIDILCYD